MTRTARRARDLADLGLVVGLGVLLTALAYFALLY